jgi:lipopolysaccharide export system protein LptA
VVLADTNLFLTSRFGGRFSLNLHKINALNRLLFCIFFAMLFFVASAQVKTQKQESKIIVENADFGDINQTEIPDAMLLSGNVRVRHEGMVVTCNKAYYFQKENYLKAFGDVHMVQGDTLFMDSKYAEYNGNVKQAFATGNVNLRSPDMTLVTDTINFDRNIQQAWYNTYGTITNKDNVLKSKSGRYFVKEKKYQFTTAVTLTNPKYVMKSNHLDYYTGPGHAYLFGPSTITSKANYIYTEKGFYDTKKNLAHFLRKSYIKYNDRRIEADSLYYDRTREFASGTNNVKITDTINKGVVKGHYAEVFKNKDSMYVTKRAVAISLVESDSVYIHGKILMVTGKEGQRVVRAFKNARFFKSDMSGKCDSIHSEQAVGLTKLIGNPIMWNFENQMTGDIMHLISNKETEKLDSLKVLNNAFLVSKDTIGGGFNQVKGQNLYGKFRDNKLRDVDIVKNTEVVYYMYNDQNELIGINKNVSSKINLTLEDSTIDTITFFKTVDGEIYPEKDLPENARKLRGFVWRADERIKTKDDIFPPEENELDAKIQADKKAELDKADGPMEVRKETTDYDKTDINPTPKPQPTEPVKQ